MCHGKNEINEIDGRMLPARLLIRTLVAIVQSGFGHSFAQSALFDELFLQCFQLLIQQVIGLMNQANRDVRNHLCRTGFDELSIQFKCLRCPPSHVTHKQGFFGIFFPNRKVADSQVIAKIGQQFFQTGPADVCQFDFRFLRCRRRLAAFQNVLLARTNEPTESSDRLCDRLWTKTCGRNEK